MTQGGPAHFEYVLVRLDLEAQRTDCHLLEVLAIINTLAQVSQTATHEGLPARLLIVRHHAPAVKHAVHGLCLGCGDRQSMQPAIVVLLFHPAVPGGESFGEFEVSRLCAQPVNNFQSIGSRVHIILPHIEPQFELSTPEIRQPTLDRVQLAALLLLEPLIEHPLLELTIEDEPLRVPLGEKLGYQPVLLDQHHWVARQLEPECQGVFLLPAVAMQDQVPQAVDRAELVDVAARDPERLINGSFLGAIERFLQGLFKLSGGEEFDVHAVQAAHVVPGPLVQIHRVPILVLKLDIGSLGLVFLSLQLVNISIPSGNFIFSRSAHFRRLPY